MAYGVETTMRLPRPDLMVVVRFGINAGNRNHNLTDRPLIQLAYQDTEFG
jgi:hypothetical protein